MKALVDLLDRLILTFKDKKYVEKLIAQIKEEEKENLMRQAGFGEINVFCEEFNNKRQLLKEADQFLIDNYYNDFYWSKPIKIHIENHNYTVKNWANCLEVFVKYILDHYVSCEYFSKSKILCKILSKSDKHLEKSIPVDFCGDRFYLNAYKDPSEIIEHMRDLYEEFDMNKVKLQFKNSEELVNINDTDDN